MASFALHSALSSAVKTTGATCGAVLSFWDPESATLSSVEINEGPVGVVNGSNNNDPTAQVAAMLERQVSAFENLSFTAMKSTGSGGGGDIVLSNTDSPVKDFGDVVPSAAEFVPSSSSIRQEEEEEARQQKRPQQQGDGGDDGADDIDGQKTPPARKRAPSTFSTASQPPPPSPTNKGQQQQSPRGLGSTLRSQGRRKLLSSTQNGVPTSFNNTASFSPTTAAAAAILSPTAVNGGRPHSSAVGKPLYSCAPRCVAVCGDPTPELTKAMTPNVQQAVAKSGVAVHCTSQSAPYMCLPITASISAVHHLYSAVSKRLLEEGAAGWSNSSVVVGLLVLVGTPVGRQTADELFASLENNNNNNNDSFCGCGGDDGLLPRFATKQVAFRAEDESVAMSICRTVLSEVLTTCEGVQAPEKSISTFLSGGGGGTNNNNSSSPSSTSFRRHQQRGSSNNNNRSGSFLRATAKKVRMMASSFRAASASNNASFSGASLSAATAIVSPSSPARGGERGGENNDNSNLAASFVGNRSFAASMRHDNTSFSSAAAATGTATGTGDFYRSTQQRRIPQIIRIPDSTIFLTQKGILSQKSSEFQALPDLPEVRRCIEEAEAVLASLREQNMDLQNVTNQKSKKFLNNSNAAASRGGGLSSSSSGAAVEAATSFHDGMERYEKKISSLTSENASLRNHIEMLTHRLDSVLSRGSLSREQEVMQRTVLGDALRGMFGPQEFQNTFRPVSSSSSRLPSRQQQAGRQQQQQQRPSSSVSSCAAAGVAPASAESVVTTSRPPTATMMIVARPPSSRRAADVLDRPLPASVLLEKKAIENLDKLKRECATRKNVRKFNG